MPAELRVDTGTLAAPRYFRLLSRQGWAVESADVLWDMAAIAQRAGDLGAVERFKAQRDPDTPRVRVRDGVAIVPVIGPIFPRANLFTEISGATSLQTLTLDMQRMLERDDIRSIMLTIDSPGGAVTEVDETAGVIADIARRKPVTAFVSGSAASAAYWLATAASEIVVTRSGQVGSIGVVAMVAKQQNPDGAGMMEFEIVSTNAPDKRPDPETDEGRAAIVARIDPIERLFIDTVAANRGVSRDKVLADFGRGGMLDAERALSVGMADRIATFEDTVTRLAERGKQPSPLAGASATNAQQGRRSMSDDQTTAEVTTSADTNTTSPSRTSETTSAPPPAPAPAPAPAAADPADIAEACNAAGAPGLASTLIREGVTMDAAHQRIRDHVNTVGEIRAICTKAGSLNPDLNADDLAADLVKRGVTVEQARKEVFDKLVAGQSEDSAIHSRTRPDTPSAPGDGGWDQAFDKAGGRKGVA